MQSGGVMDGNDLQSDGPREAMELAPCGLDCDDCGQKPEHCDGCHADSDHLWHADCAIRVCCKFDKQLSNCSQCDGFPCERILSFEADRWDHHTAAVACLRHLRG